ncbi:MAG: hypothetical protein V7641_3215 [Blastocatellia bacterium]
MSEQMIDEGFVFTVVEEKGDEVTIEVSEEDYQREKAAGVEEEALLKPGRHKFIRGGFKKRHPDFDAKQALAQTRIILNLALDHEVLTFFKEQSALPDAPPVDEQINLVLREFMIRSKTAAEAARLLNDASFIAAVAERVKDHLNKRD